MGGRRLRKRFFHFARIPYRLEGEDWLVGGGAQRGAPSPPPPAEYLNGDRQMVVEQGWNCPKHGWDFPKWSILRTCISASVFFTSAVFCARHRKTLPCEVALCCCKRVSLVHVIVLFVRMAIVMPYSDHVCCIKNSVNT